MDEETKDLQHSSSSAFLLDFLCITLAKLPHSHQISRESQLKQAWIVLVPFFISKEDILRSDGNTPQVLSKDERE